MFSIVHAGAKKVLDIGVFTGASALNAALALPEDGLVVGCDISEEWTKTGRKFWKEAGVEHKVKLVIAPAGETLQVRTRSRRRDSYRD